MHHGINENSKAAINHTIYAAFLFSERWNIIPVLMSILLMNYSAPSIFALCIA